jgi:hypothetical protein
MATYYCVACRVTLAYSPALPSGPLLQTDYQRQKHEKHTLVDPSKRLQSIFTNPSTASIRLEVEEALVSGPMEIDDEGRINFLTLSGAGSGFRYEWGTRIEAQDVTKVVLSSNAGLRHQFTEASTMLGAQRCCVCGNEIFGAST